MHRPPTKLIDYAFVIGVDHRGATATAEASTNAAGSSSSSLSSCPSTTATTYFCYPPIPTGHEGALNNITPFCFPEAVVVVHDNVNSNNTVLASSSTGTTSTPPRHHDFVLTDEKGQKRFASCLRTSAVQVVTSEGTTGKSEASTYAFCLVSNQPRFNSLRACLYELLQRIRGGRAGDAESFLWHLIHGIIIPPSGSVVTRLRLRSIAHDIRLYSPPTTKSLPILDFSVARACAVFRAPASTHNSPLYVKLVPVFRALSIRNVVALFNLLLLERKIVVHSKSLSLVTRVCEALMAFLFPLQWDMVYVPVVPEALRDLAQAPTPFLMGGESRWVTELEFPLPPRNQLPTSRSQNFGGDHLTSSADDNDDLSSDTAPVCVVDLDHDEVSEAGASCLGSRLALPGRQQMIASLRHLFYPHMNELDNEYPDVLQAEKRMGGTLRGTDTMADPLVSANLDERIRNVFFDWFLDAFRSMREYYRKDGRFDQRKWVEGKATKERAFYATFAKTSMFQAFTETRSPDEDVRRTHDMFDELVAANKKSHVSAVASTGRKLGNKLRILSTSNLDAKDVTSVEFNLSNGGTMTSEPSPTPIFNLCLFKSYFADFGNAEYEKARAVIERTIEQCTNPADMADLHWMRGYLHDKLAKTFIDGVESGVNASIGIKCLHDWSASYELKMSRVDARDELELLGVRIARLVPKLPRSDIDEWLKFLAVRNAALKDAMQKLVVPAVSADKVPTPIPSPRPSPIVAHGQTSHDRMILNCNPTLENHAHIDSHDALDDVVTELDIDESLRSYFCKPIELSVAILDAIASMCKVVSQPPHGMVDNGTAHGATLGGSMDDLGSAFSSITDYFRRGDHGKPGGHSRRPSADPEVSQLAKLDRNHYILHDVNALRDIKRMPMYEKFKQLIVILRHARIEEKLVTDEQKSCFWLNVRNAMILHILVEFGLPTSFQHRMTFFYHKLVYHIAGRLFSVNEITFGILKATQPLPTLVGAIGHGKSTAVAPNAGGLTITNLATISASTTPVLATKTTTASPEKSHHLNVPSLQVGDNQRQSGLQAASPDHTTTFGTSKIPLKFTTADSRYALRVQHPPSWLQFALTDATKSGPRITVYTDPKTLANQLITEAEHYLTQFIVVDKVMTAEAGGGLMSGLNKRKVLSMPQFLTWYMRDVLPNGTTEEYAVALAKSFPRTVLGKFMLEDSPSGQKKDIRVREHVWDFELRFPAM